MLVAYCVMLRCISMYVFMRIRICICVRVCVCMNVENKELATDRNAKQWPLQLHKLILVF